MKRWYNLKYWFHKNWHDNLPRWFSSKLPKKLIYWCAIHVGVNATTGEYSNQVVPELFYMDALKRWEDKS